MGSRTSSSTRCDLFTETHFLLPALIQFITFLFPTTQVHLTRPKAIANEHKDYEGGDGLVEALVFEASRPACAHSVPTDQARAASLNRTHPGRIAALRSQVSDRALIGYQPPKGGPRRYCCTEDLVNATGCTPRRLIVQARRLEPSRCDLGCASAAPLAKR